MLIILDLDGTIIDSQNQYLNTFIKSIRRVKGYINKEEIEGIKKRFGKPDYDIIREVFPSISEMEVNLITAGAKNFLFTEEFDNIKLLPTVLEFLKENKNKHEFSLATSSTKDFTQKILEKFDLKKYFNIVLTKNDIVHSKPNPEILLKTLKLTQREKSESVFIGDTIYDYECAKKAGIRFIAILQNSLFANELVKKAECVKNFREIKL